MLPPPPPEALPGGAEGPPLVAVVELLLQPGEPVSAPGPGLRLLRPPPLLPLLQRLLLLS